VVHL